MAVGPSSKWEEEVALRGSVYTCAHQQSWRECHAFNSFQGDRTLWGHAPRDMHVSTPCLHNLLAASARWLRRTYQPYGMLPDC